MKLVMPLLAVALSLPSSAETGPLPHDVVKVKSQRDAKVDEIDRVYLAELEKLRAKHENEGTGAAPAIAKLIAQIREEGQQRTVPDTRWAWGSGGSLTLYGSGKARHTAWTKDGKWTKQEDGSVLLESPTGLAFTITFDKSGIGRVKALDGRSSTTITKKE